MGPVDVCMGVYLCVFSCLCLPRELSSSGTVITISTTRDRFLILKLKETRALEKRLILGLGQDKTSVFVQKVRTLRVQSEYTERTPKSA